MTVQQIHTYERVGGDGIYGNAPRLFVPDNRGLVNVEKALASVCQDGTPTPAKRKTERRYEQRRQGQEAVKARINDSLDLFFGLRAMHRQVDNGFAVGIHRTGYHVVADQRRGPKRRA